MAIGEVKRITSADIVVEFKPALYPGIEAANYACYEDSMNHVVVLDRHSAASGQYALVVDGHKTALIDYNDVNTDVQAALQALPNVGSGNLLVTGTTPLTITAAGALLNKFLVIEVADDTTNTGVSLAVTSQGSSWYSLDSEIIDLSYTDTQESVDTTGISEKDRRHTSTVRDGSFDMTLYEALQDYRAILISGVEGYLRVFEHGKATGKRYFAWEVLLKDGGTEFKQFDKVQISVSGRRQGSPIARIGSIW